MSENRPGTITAGELRKMIADLADSDLILFMKEDNGVGYNAESIEFTPAYVEKTEEESYLPTLWIID